MSYNDNTRPAQSKLGSISTGRKQAISSPQGDASFDVFEELLVIEDSKCLLYIILLDVLSCIFIRMTMQCHHQYEPHFTGDETEEEGA